jgi:hypothetical protein
MVSGEEQGNKGWSVAAPAAAGPTVLERADRSAHGLRRLPLRRVAVVALLGALVLPGLAWAGGGPAYQAGATATPPTIDGTVTAGEWAGSTAYSLSFGSIPATVRFEHTATGLYVAVVVQDLAPGTAPSIAVYFDNNHDGIKDPGDDAWLGPLAQDFYYSPTGTGGASHYHDSVGGGTNETIAAGTSTSGAVTFEISHPLCSADTAHDICATVGQTLGVDFQYSPGTVGFYDAPGPDAFNPSVTWGDLLLAAGDVTAPTVTVTQPVAGSVLSGTSVSVAADASDNVGVTSVHFQYYDPPTYYDLGTDTDAPYTATFDSTTVPNTVPLGATIYATARDAAGNTTTVGNGVGVHNTAAGSLSGSVVASPDPAGSPRSVDLTAVGNEDWAIWGYAGAGTSTSLAPDVRKARGFSISNLTNIDPAPSAPLRGLGQFAGPFSFSWFDGGSQPEGAGVRAGIQHNGEPPTSVSTLGKGFSFDVPAGTSSRTLTVYVATNRASGQLTASLSDGSAANYVDTLPLARDIRSGVYTIHYAAASAGQTLHVQWVETVDNCTGFRCDNAALYAVALASAITPTTVTASLDSDPSVQMSGSNDAIDSIPLRAFEQGANGPNATVNGAPINTLPINTLPINTLPINTLPINTLPINTLPINTLPINTLGGWSAVLNNATDQSLKNVPLQTITLRQVLALNPQHRGAGPRSGAHQHARILVPAARGSHRLVQPGRRRDGHEWRRHPATTDHELHDLEPARWPVGLRTVARGSPDQHVADQHVADQHVADQHVADQHAADQHARRFRVTDQHAADQHVADQHARDDDCDPDQHAVAVEHPGRAHSVRRPVALPGASDQHAVEPGFGHRLHDRAAQLRHGNPGGGVRQRCDQVVGQARRHPRRGGLADARRLALLRGPDDRRPREVLARHDAAR